MGHERTLLHFLEEHARDLAAAANATRGSHSTATSTDGAQTRRRNISAVDAMLVKRGKLHVAALAIEVRLNSSLRLLVQSVKANASTQENSLVRTVKYMGIGKLITLYWLGANTSTAGAKLA